MENIATSAWVEKQSARWGAAVNTIKNHWLYDTSGKNTEGGISEIETPTVPTKSTVKGTQHEEVKIGRAVTWIDEEWANLPFCKEHKSAAAAFQAVSVGKASDTVTVWVEKQSVRWGAAVGTIKNQWLYQQDSHKARDEKDHAGVISETPTVPTKSTVKGTHAL